MSALAKLCRLLAGLFLLGVCLVPTPLNSNPGSSVSVRVFGIRVDLDTRPDQEGVQYSMTAVRGFPTAVHTLVGAPGYPLAADLAEGLRVKAVLHGPAFDPEGEPLEALPNQLFEIANIPVEGDYQLTDIRLEDTSGRRILGRDPGLPAVHIQVIDKLLVTQVTSRALSLEEIREKGIVIDQEHFTAVNFSVGLTLGSKKVQIDLPVAVPTTKQAMASVEPPQLTGLPAVQRAFDAIDIPNFSLSGFQLSPPPEIQEQEGIELPPINGVIVIPGNIGFLNQFFSVVLQATNVAPDGSGLVLRQARAEIRLPKGKDEVLDSGDDPLRVAKVEAKGRQTELPLQRPGAGAQPSADIGPQQTNQAEFLVEGRREGTHRVDFDIRGELFVPALGKTVAMTGAAAGVVQVKNPTFSISLAHPKVVREGEEYAVFATVTNTSTSPANLFQLGLNTRSLSGARPAEGEPGLRELDTLAPGQAESFELRLVAETTGEVRGTVFLADEGINGNFLLTTGVGDTGIPLSPDTLVLPDTVAYLPSQPDLLFQAVRLLGQAYSLATAPGGSLPPDMPRVRKGFVLDRAVKLAQAGLHVRFGETPLGAVGEVLMDYLSPGLIGEQASIDDKDRVAFDLLRRKADAGHDFSEALGGVLARNLGEQRLAEMQEAWGQRFASGRSVLSVAAQLDGGAVELRLTDAEGRALGRLNAEQPVARDIPFAARLPLVREDADHGQLLLAPPGDGFELELAAAEGTRLRLSLLLPGKDGLRQVLYPELDLPQGGTGRLQWQSGSEGPTLVVQRPDGAPSSVAPQQLVAIQDPPPALVGVAQWAKGAMPAVTPTFANGDPLGRMLGVLFSEDVDGNAAANVEAYRVEDNQVTGVALQPDGRLAFVLLERPVGPFEPRQLQVTGIRDLAGKMAEDLSAPIQGDPERGMGAHFQGRVVNATGEPVPFAQVKYIQPLIYPTIEGGCMDEQDAADHVVASYEADADGRFSIDYVLRVELPPGCPSNPDQWLNKNNSRATQNFKLEALDPESGEVGKASARIHYDEQRMAFDVIIRGYGSVGGRLLEPDGKPMTGSAPDAPHALRVIARNVSTGETYQTWVDADGRYSFPFSHTGQNGRLLEAPRVAVGNVILHVVRPADGYSAVTTVNLERAGIELEQDLVLLAPTAYGTVSGRVVEADGNTPAANVQVQIAGRVLTRVDLYERNYGRGVIDAAVTDQAGRFRFERIPSGDIQLRALRQSTYEMVDAKAYLAEQASEELTLVFPGSGGAVRGLVRDALGNPVAGAKVAGGPTLTETDEQGQFEIKGLPLGRFTLYAQGLDSPALAKLQIDGLGPGEVQEVVLTLEPVGSITGTLYQADGLTPVAGQKVQLWVEPDAGVLAETWTLADGQFRFDNYPVGDYSLRAVRRDRGDGGMVYTAIRFAGDVQDADLRLSGLGEIRGRVVQTNGTPAVSDVIVSHKVWRVLTEEDDERTKLFRAYIKVIKDQSDEKSAKQIEQAMREAGLSRPVNELYMLMDEATPIRSDILGPKGEVTGELKLQRVLAGPFTVAALGPFLTPAEAVGEIPRSADPAKRLADIGDLVLEPATAQVKGTVYLPDGKTPAGPNIEVQLRSLDSAGGVMSARGAVKQPVLPEIKARTDDQGRFHFPLMLRGRFVLTVDTGAPDAKVRARSTEQIRNDLVAMGEGAKGLNVRLYGQAGGVAPAGEVMETDVRLQGAGGVEVQVLDERGKPAPYAQVSLQTASALDADQEQGELRDQRADKEGRISFLPVTEGRFSLSAAAPKSPARGRAEGVIPKRPQDGLLVPVKITLGAVTTAAGKVVKAQVFGSVKGQVLRADGSPLENPAQVTVQAQGVSLLATSLAEGRFQVDDVPGGAVSVEAFEPYTARRGETRGQLESNAQVLDLAVQLTGLGRVTGTLTNHAGDRPIPGADVVLTPSGGFSGRVVTRSDKHGGYQLPGVPLGTYTLEASDPESELKAEGRGLLKRDGQTRTTDLRLEPSGRIRGRLLSADGRSPVPNAEVEISGSRRRVVQSDTKGGFDSGPWLALGSYRVQARAREDGVVAEATLQQDRQQLELELRLAGLGRVEGLVLDSAGQQREPKAHVFLESSSPFFDKARTRFTDAQGVFRFDNVPAGPFNLRVRSTLREPELGALASGEVQSQGQTVSFRDDGPEGAAPALRLQPSGSIAGRVLMADGTTPAAGAVVAVRGRRARLGRECDAEGRFRFDALPLGDYRLELRETASNAVASRNARIETNGQLIDYDPVVLDDASPRVVEAQPADGSTDTDPKAPIRIRFSEPLDPASVHRGTLRVSAAGRSLDGEYRLSEDGTLVELLARGGLPDLQTVQLVLAGQELGPDGSRRSAGITDLAGRSLEEDLVLRFTTRDATPPKLVKTSPEAGARGLPVKTVVRLELSEPIDPGSVAQVILKGNGKPVKGRLNAKPILGGRVLAFVPEGPLQPNTEYELSIDGPVRDASGNPMPEPQIRLAFSTLDTRAPRIAGLDLPKDVEPVSGRRLPVAVRLQDTEDLDYVELYRNSQWVHSIRKPPFEYPVYLDPALGERIELGAVAVDRSGNRSQRAVQVLKVQANRPPKVRILSPTEGEISVGQTVSLEIAAEDDIGIRRLAYTLDGGRSGGLARVLEDPLSARQGLPLTLPEGHPVGGEVTIQAIAEDRLGELARSAPVTLAVVDRYPPRITLQGVEHGAKVEPGASLELGLEARDAGGVTLVSLAVDGVVTLQQTQRIEPARRRVEKTYQIQVPAEALATQRLRITARAVDAEGNGDLRQVDLGLADRVAPQLTFTVDRDRTEAEPGQDLYVQLRATDEIGVTGFRVQLGDETLAEEGFAAGKEVQKGYRLRIPAELALGKDFELTGMALDEAGNQGLASAKLTAKDLNPPGVELLGPPQGTELLHGKRVPVRVKAQDPFGVARIQLTVSGAFQGSQEKVFKKPDQEVEAELVFVVPEDAPPGHDFHFRAEAFDQAGNRGERWSGWLRVKDLVPPHVVKVSPEDGSRDQGPGLRIVVTIDETLDRGSVTPERFQLLDQDGQPLEADIGWEYYTGQPVLTPKQPLPMGRSYRVRMADVTDRFGNRLAKPFESAFRVKDPDLQGPRIVEVTPADGAEGVSLQPDMRVKFDESLHYRSLQEGLITLLDDQDQEHPIRSSWYDDYRELRLYSDLRLKPGRKYRFRLLPRGADAAGNPITDPEGRPFEQWLATFTTGAMTLVRPAAGEAVPENRGIRLKIQPSEGMEPASIEVTANGKPLMPARPPAFETHCLTPRLVDAAELELGMRALDRDGKEIARGRARVPLAPALYAEPSLLGLTQGATAGLNFRIDPPPERDVAVRIAVSDPAVARLSADTVVLKSGRGAGMVTGLKPGETHLAASSEMGSLAVMLSVAQEVGPSETVVTKADLGVGVGSGGFVVVDDASFTLVGLPLHLAVSSPETSGLLVSPTLGLGVSSGAVLGPVQLPRAGRYRLVMALGEGAEEEATAQSSEPDVVRPLGPPAQAERAGLWALMLEAVGSGEAVVRLSIGDTSLGLPVQMGLADLRPTGISTPPLALAVFPYESLGRVHLQQPEERELWVTLLPGPAKSDLPLQVKSSDPAVLGAEAPARIAQGEQAVPLKLIGKRPGVASVVLEYGGRSYSLEVGVGADGAVPTPQVSQPGLLAVRPPAGPVRAQAGVVSVEITADPGR